MRWRHLQKAVQSEWSLQCYRWSSGASSAPTWATKRLGFKLVMVIAVGVIPVAMWSAWRSYAGSGRVTLRPGAQPTATVPASGARVGSLRTVANPAFVTLPLLEVEPQKQPVLRTIDDPALVALPLLETADRHGEWLTADIWATSDLPVPQHYEKLLAYCSSLDSESLRSRVLAGHLLAFLTGVDSALDRYRSALDVLPSRRFDIGATCAGAIAPMAVLEC